MIISLKLEESPARVWDGSPHFYMSITGQDEKEDTRHKQTTGSRADVSHTALLPCTVTR